MYIDERISVLEAFSLSFLPCQISQLLFAYILYLATESQPSFDFIFIFGISFLRFGCAVLPIPAAIMLFSRSKSFSVSVSAFVFGLFSWLPLLTSPATQLLRIPYPHSAFTNAPTSSSITKKSALPSKQDCINALLPGQPPANSAFAFTGKTKPAALSAVKTYAVKTSSST
ncbi:hypothetical protein OCU04_012922 [Sclerotinia nivalis]|uniref:Uncharacterized protein n=1 Tax=Sclerotinia nivalis TaxID=352851 RepID=A0A9X0ABZ4_9HELO|nr:hypothetical protein OCU04_012922 [Sclerotinia nivalis]